MIKIQDLKKDYVNDDVATSVLRGLSFNIQAGEFVAIMGPSGSGKSTLMHILGFLDRATGGIYLYKDKNVNDYSNDELARLRNEEFGFVFQAFNLLPRTSVLENVLLPLQYSKKKNQQELAKKAIESVGLSHRVNYLSNQLSGGEKQRVAIARALVNNPAVIFADEPTGNLDSKSGHQVMKILQTLNAQGKTIILVTHEKYTSEHAARIIQLKDGLLVADTVVANRLVAEQEDGLLK